MDYFLENGPKFTPNRHYTDDNCKSYREENRKKDEIIKQLCKMNPDGVSDMNFIKTSNSANYQRHESAALQVKIDRYEENLRSKQYEIDGLKEQVAICRKEKEIIRLEAEKLENENRKLITENNQNKAQIEAFDSLKYRSEFTIKSLQDQYQNSQMKVAELEARIKTILEDRERMDQLKHLSESKYQNFMFSISKLVSITDINDTDAILEKLTEISRENAILNGKVQSLELKVKTAEDDANTARDTIVKLMRDYEGVGVGQENLRETKTHLQTENADLKNQIELLKNRQESLQKLYDTVSEERDDKITKLLELELKLREKEFATQSGETVLKSLIECLAAMLSTPYIPCQPTESAVKDKVKQLVEKLKEQTAAAEVLDKRVLQLQKQFESQYETGKTLLDRSKDADSIKQQLENQIKTLEDDLMAKDILMDNLKCEIERITKHVFRVADLLQVDYLPSDSDIFGLLGILQERCQEMILNRPPNQQNGSRCCKCAQIAAGSFDSSSEAQKQARRVTGLKEELEAKDLKIKMLEKRLEQSGYPEKDNRMESCETNREKAHRLHHQLEASQMEIEDLRRALIQSQTSEYELHKQDRQKQQNEVEQLSATIEKLDKVRQKQAKKIANLKSMCEEKSSQLQSTSKKDRDLKQARNLLEDTRRREIELSEFRDMVAGLLGVDVRCARDPNGEIRSRIQKLMSMAQSTASTPFTPYYLSQDMSTGFQSGYNKPITSLGYMTQQPSQYIPNTKTNHPCVTFDSGDGSNNTMTNFSRRQQLPKSRINFQPPSSSSLIKSSLRARSTSPAKRDERKY